MGAAVVLAVSDNVLVIVMRVLSLVEVLGLAILATNMASAGRLSAERREVRSTRPGRSTDPKPEVPDRG